MRDFCAQGRGILTGKYMNGARPEGARLSLFDVPMNRRYLEDKASGTRGSALFLSLVRGLFDTSVSRNGVRMRCILHILDGAVAQADALMHRNVCVSHMSRCEPVRDLSRKCFCALGLQVDQIVAQYVDLAKELKITPAQLALAWVKSRWYVGSTIIGATATTHLKENIEAFDVELPEEALKKIDFIHLQDKDPVAIV